MPTGDREYKKLRRIATELENKLYTHFTPEAKKLYEDTRLAQMEVDSFWEFCFFKKTLAFGALLMLELMREDVTE